MRTTKAAALARPAHEQCDPSLLDLDTLAQRVYQRASERVLPVLARIGQRWQWVRRRRTDNSCRALTEVGQDVVSLWNAGATEAELRPFANYINDVIDRLSTGRAMRPLHALDQAEQELEGQETSLQMSRLIHEAQRQPISAEELLHEADVTEAEAGVEFEKSRILRRQARCAQLSCLLIPVTPAMPLAQRIQVGLLTGVILGVLYALIKHYVADVDRRAEEERHRRSW